MRSTRHAVALMVLLSLWVVSCSTVPVTGRRQLTIIPSGTMLSMSYQQYDEFLNAHPTITGTPEAERVKRVGRRIQDSVEAYFADQGMSSELQGYAWEFNLVDSPEINAWCMPGGKVVVYSGILGLMDGEPELAVVMGHEIAHAVADHGNERMSQGLLTQLGGMALSKALEEKPEQTQQLWMAAFGLGAQFGVLLPYSRKHENEADHLGLIFMAMAGYDPHAAIGFWQKMKAEKGGQAPPEFMSTHPSDDTRIENIRELMPKVMEYYRPSQQ